MNIFEALTVRGEKGNDTWVTCIYCSRLLKLKSCHLDHIVTHDLIISCWAEMTAPQIAKNIDYNSIQIKLHLH